MKRSLDPHSLATVAARVVFLCGGVLALSLSAQAQTLSLRAVPGNVTISTRDQAVIQVTVYNNGAEDASGATAHITFAKGLKMYPGANCISNRSGLTCLLGTVPAGGSFTFTVVTGTFKAGDYWLDLQADSSVGYSSSDLIVPLYFR